MIRLTLDYPPSANRYWRHDRGYIHLSAAALEYRQHVALICVTAGIQPGDGDVAVTMRFYRPAKRGDLDNRVKIALDALQGYAYVNDSQISELHAYRCYDKYNPRVEVTVEPR